MTNKRPCARANITYFIDSLFPYHCNGSLELEGLLHIRHDGVVRDGSGGPELPGHHLGHVEHEGLVGGDVVRVALGVQVHGVGQAQAGLVNLHKVEGVGLGLQLGTAQLLSLRR